MNRIVLHPNKILRAKTEAVKILDDKILREMEKLKEILSLNSNGAGLAATQIGVAKRFFGLKNLENKESKIFINPKIEKFYGEKVYPKIINENGDEDFLEGCLSFPDFYGTVRRYLKLGVSWHEAEKGILVKREKEIQGFEAIVFQHELDHLEGILFVDYVKNESGKFYKWKGKKMVSWDIDRVLNPKKD